MTSAAVLRVRRAMGRAMRNGEVNWRAQAGFAYLLLLVAVALIGLFASAAVSIGASMTRRDAEQQLLVIGLEYQRALRSYATASIEAGGTVAGRGPQTLEQLLKDSRQLHVRRHLRRLYADPLTGKQDWALIRDSEGSVVGIYSRAGGRPIQRGGFDPVLIGFDDASSYVDWVFGLPVVHKRPITRFE